MDKELLLRVKTDVQGGTQVEQLSTTFGGLAESAKRTGPASATAAASIRDMETRATAANISFAEAVRVMEDVNERAEVATELFERLKLEYMDGKISMAEYQQSLAELRQGLQEADGETTRLIRTERALATEQQRLTSGTKLAAIGFEGTTTQASNANSVLFQSQNVIRGLNGDFPALARSITPTLRGFNQLQLQSGGTIGAFRAMLGVLGGPMGLVFLLGSMLPTAIIASSNFLEKFKEEANLTKEETADLTRQVIELIEANARLAAAPSPFDIESRQLTINELERIIGLLEQEGQAVKNLSSARAGIRSERGTYVDPEAVDAAIADLEAVRKVIGDDANRSLEDLRKELDKRKSEQAEYNRELTNETLKALEERNKSELEKARLWSAEQLAERRHQTAQEIELARERLETATDEERQHLEARIRMNEEFMWSLAAIYARMPRPVTPERSDWEPDLSTPTEHSLSPGEPPAAGLGRSQAEQDEDARMQRQIATALAFQQELSRIELDLIRQAGREKEALEIELERELRRIRIEALENGIYDTEEHLNLEYTLKQKFAIAEGEIDKNLNDLRLQNTLMMSEGITALMGEAFGKHKGLAKATAYADGLVASISALKSPPGPPWTIPLAGAMLFRAKNAAEQIDKLSPSGGSTPTAATGGMNMRGISPVNIAGEMRNNTAEISRLRQDRSNDSSPIVNIPDTIKLTDRAGKFLTELEFARDRSPTTSRSQYLSSK